MNSSLAEFLRRIIRDSISLEQSWEPGQTFDKLARGIESLLPDQEGQSQKDKAVNYFTKRLAEDDAWRDVHGKADQIRRFINELCEYLDADARDEARQLQKYA